jgi:phosphohistidine phosphatase
MANPKFLYLLRHGDAEPGIGRLGDLRRSLSEKGKIKINMLSNILKGRGITFDLILVSPSTRTTETAEIISKDVLSKEISVEDEIYEAEISDLLDLINKTEGEVEKLLLVGHNPALSSLVSYLTGIDSVNMLPGMLSIIEIQVREWTEVGGNTGILKETII